MYVSIEVCTHAYKVLSLHVSMYVCVCVRMHTYMYMYNLYACTYVCMHLYFYVCICMYLYECMYIQCMHMCLHEYLLKGVLATISRLLVRLKLHFKYDQIIENVPL